MKAFKKLIVIALACLVMMPFASIKGYAAAGTISLSDPTAKVGESVSVTVKVTATGSETIKSVDMKLSYDESALEFEDTAGATGEKGVVTLTGTADSAIKTYTVNFKALKGSTSSIKITDYTIKDSKDAVMEMTKVGSSTVTVSGEGTVSTTDTQESEGQEETVQVTTQQEKIVNPPKKDVEVKIAGTSFYACKISKDIIPEGFEYIGYMYDGVAVDAVKKDDFILFYLNQIGEPGYVFYTYDPNTDGFSVYAPIYPNFEYAVVNLDEDVTVPEGFTETSVSVSGVAVTAWQSNTNPEYYLLYLMNSEGGKNFYLYDIVEKTVQRYYYSGIESTGQTTDSYQTLYTELNNNYKEEMQKKTSLIYILIVIMVILIFAVINIALRLVDKKHAQIEEEDEEELDTGLFYQEIDNSKSVEEFTEQEPVLVEEEKSDYQDEVDEKDLEDEDVKEELDKQAKKEMKKAARLEKKERAKRERAKKAQELQEDESVEFQNSEDDFDDSDDFELQIFDFDDKK